MDALTEARWEEAMTWWKSNPHSTLIRQRAIDKMIQRGCEEIGSSDINCQVYSMWQDWERSKDQYAQCKCPVDSFLSDYMTNY